MESKNRKIRIKDIAALARVSTGTVDRVLHNRREVNEETRKKVMKIVKDLGYTPNILAKSLATKKTTKIAVLIPESDPVLNPYWEKPLIGINKAVTELHDFNTDVNIFTFNTRDEETFSNQFTKILDKEPDGVVFTPLFRDQSLYYAKKCAENQIPNIIIDTYQEKLDPIAYFGQDSVQSGYLGAKLMFYTLPEDSKILVLNIANKGAITRHLKRREEGFLAFMDKHKSEKIFNISSLEIDLIKENEPEKSLQSIFSLNPDINAIFVTNSKVNLVAEFICTNNLCDSLLIGYDLIDKNLQYLKNGAIDFLICQKPEEQGYKSIVTLFNYLLNKIPVKKMNYSQIDIIMKENIDYYKNF